MTASPMSEVLRHLRRTLHRPEGGERTDGELLERFVGRRDEAAFAALVRRHGPMVWGVCRRVLPGRHHDAEDAFQATFLVLFRKAASVVPREMVANWLYGVAHQTARNARASAAKRGARERQVTPMPEQAARGRDLWRDLQPILDLELSHLPDKYRVAIVLCDLEGKTRKEVARQLGVPEGTLSGHLTRGRTLLARRMARHGLAVSGGTLAAVLSENVSSASVPASAVAATLQAARLLASGTVAAGVLSAPVASLTEGVVKTMLLAKLKIVTAVMLVSSVAGLGAAGLLVRARAGEPAGPPPLPARGPADSRALAQKSEQVQGRSRQRNAKPKFTLGKETTYVTGPLDKDGYVDYETALNEKASQGTTPESNANVLLWKALGPHPEGGTMSPEYFRWLKAPAPPEKGDYFVPLARYAREDLKIGSGEPTRELVDQLARAARRPWVEKDYPNLAGWLKASEKPLAVVTEATRRPDYYNPVVAQRSSTEGWNGMLIGALLPNVQQCRELAAALAARAMWRTAEGKFDEAWQDLLACHRLGRLIARGTNLIEYLVGVAIDRTAGAAELAFLDRAGPTAKQARAWLRDLQGLPPLPALADRVDLGERFTFLNVLMLVCGQGGHRLGLLTALAEEGKAPKPLPAASDPQTQKTLEGLDDWDSILRKVNGWYDRLAAASRIKDHAAREKEFDRIDEELKALRKNSGTLAEVIEALRAGKDSPQELGKRLGDSLVTTLLPATRKVQTAADRAEQSGRTLRLAFALAAYRGDHGSYPVSLDALTPEYIAEVPGDLFSGKALIYRPSEKGYLLYSVGPNGRDDEGRGPEDTPPGDDLAVRMPVPELKGK